MSGWGICSEKAMCAYEFRFRQVSVDDCLLIRSLAGRIWGVTYEGILSKEQSDYMFEMMYAPESLRRQMEELHHCFFIVDANGIPSGYLSIEKTGENTFNFQKIYTLPEMHGTGIGRFLVEQGLEYLAKRHGGLFAVELFVNRSNPAVGFYRHIGFRETGTRDYPIGHGYFMNDYIMRLDVDCAELPTTR